MSQRALNSISDERTHVTMNRIGVSPLPKLAMPDLHGNIIPLSDGAKTSVALPEPKNEPKMKQTLDYVEIRSLFERFDIDQSGKLNRSKLRHMFALMGHVVEENKLDEMISIADRDGKGSVTLADFTMLLKEPEKLMLEVRKRRIEEASAITELDESRQENSNSLIKPPPASSTSLTLTPYNTSQTTTTNHKPSLSDEPQLPLEQIYHTLSLRDTLALITGKDVITSLEVKRMYRQFYEADIDKSGCLDAFEFHEMITQGYMQQKKLSQTIPSAGNGPKGRANDAATTNSLNSKLSPKTENDEKFLVRHLFDLIDLDKSGQIEMKEFLVAVSALTDADPTDKLKLAFSLYDENGNGVIDLSELKKIVQATLNAHETTHNEPSTTTTISPSTRTTAKLITDQKTLQIESRIRDIYKSLGRDADAILHHEAILNAQGKSISFAKIPTGPSSAITFPEFLKLATENPSLIIPNAEASKPQLQGKRAAKMDSKRRSEI